MKATARVVFETVGSRLQIDPAVLALLFNECLQEVLVEAQEQGVCTIRGVGKFRVTTLAELAREEKGPGSTLAVFERTRHTIKNAPFAKLGLATRMAKARVKT